MNAVCMVAVTTDCLHRNGARDNSVAPVPGQGSADYGVTVIVPVKLAYAAIDGG
jgi:hypothetical protein